MSLRIEHLCTFYTAIVPFNHYVSSVLYDIAKKKRNGETSQPVAFSVVRGAQARNRTRDTGIFSPLLYLLSYLSILVGHLGVEPRTDRL